MSKVVRLKQSDLENIINNIISEELSKEKDMSEMDGVGDNEMIVGKDENGRIVVINGKTGEIIGTK